MAKANKKKRESLKEGLQFERKNKDMLRLPKYARIHKRPIPHPPAGSPYAGASVPKIVYVSTNTPFMSAAKRVQKLLRQAEKRATAAASAITDKNQKLMTDKERRALLVQSQEKLEREKVYIKATGRAIEKALSVGRWFEQKSEEYAVQVRTGSVMVVDDIVEDEEAKKRELAREGQQQQQQQQDDEDTAMQEAGPSADQQPSTHPPAAESKTTATESRNKRRRRRKKERRMISADEELPESRTRWVNMVEIAVNLK